MENRSMSRQNYSHKFDQRRSNNQKSKWSFPASDWSVRILFHSSTRCTDRDVSNCQNSKVDCREICPRLCSGLPHSQMSLWEAQSAFWATGVAGKRDSRPVSFKSIGHACFNSSAFPSNLKRYACKIVSATIRMRGSRCKYAWVQI